MAFLAIRFSVKFEFSEVPEAELECFSQADVCFVLDSSGSLCAQNEIGSACSNWVMLLSFVSDIIDAFHVGSQETRIGVVTFSTDAQLDIAMNEFYDREELKDVVSQIKNSGGQTNTGKALHITRTQCFSEQNERSGVPNIAIVITDGLPTILEFDTNAEAVLLKEVATVLAVGVTQNVESQLLQDISSFPQKENQNYFSTPDFASLGNILKALVVETCQAPLKTLAPISGTHCPSSSQFPLNLSFPLCFVVVIVQFILISELQCFKQADVCLVVDTSGSICGPIQVGTCDNWSLLLSFVSQIIEAFNIGEKQTRVGLVTFSDDASLMFPMNRFYELQEIKDVVSSLRHMGGETNTGKALHISRTACFSSSNGEREGVPNIAVVLTDGLPTIMDFNFNTEAALLKQTATVLAVGIGESIESELLREMSSPPQRENENYFTSPDFSSLSSIIGALVSETCEATMVTQPPLVSGGIPYNCIHVTLFEP